jgi:8-oxo-dGTP pyrophosphatase MutT (NUDIX family)
MKQLHKVQLGILKKLLFSDSTTYTQMKPDPEMGNNQFDFHLKTLMSVGLVTKINSQYKLTQKGKEYANRMDTDINKIPMQAKLSVWVCITRGVSKKEYLIGTRLKQPFFGKQGFIAGKIKFGEEILDAARREMKEETNLEGEPSLVLIRHFLVFDKKTNKLLEDKFMFLCRVDDPKGELANNEEVKLDWIKESELREKITEPFERIDDFIDIVNIAKNFKKEVLFQEVKEYTDNF